MQYIGFIFGIFGLLAYLELSSLKKRVADLERELTKIKGSSFHEDRNDLYKTAKTYIGKKITLDLKEDHKDFDVINYGNSKYGSITIKDLDEEWMSISIETPKGNKDKIIRMESINRMTLAE